MKKLISLSILFSILSSCFQEVEKDTELENVDTYKSKSINEFTELELANGSSDITSCYNISIDDSLFPNANQYDLESPKAFYNVDESGYSIKTEYFYSLKDSIVRAILYEWNWNSYDNYFNREFSPEREESKKLYNKFEKITESLTNKLGEPTNNKIVKKDYHSENYTWNSKGSTKAYLFIVGDRSKSFYRLRLITYE